MSTTTKPLSLTLSSPAPMHLIGTILNLISQTYPEAQMTTARPGEALRLEIPEDAQPQGAAEPKDHILEAMRVDTAGIKIATPQELVAQLTTAVDAALEAEPLAVNYLEQGVVIQGRGYAISLCRSGEQTPHELRMAAERRADEAEARLRDMEATATPGGGTVTVQPPQGKPSRTMTLLERLKDCWVSQAGMGEAIVSDGCGHFSVEAAPEAPSSVSLSGGDVPLGWELVPNGEGGVIVGEDLFPEGEYPDYPQHPDEMVLAQMIAIPGAYQPVDVVDDGRRLGWALLRQERESGDLPAVSVEFSAGVVDAISDADEREPAGLELAVALEAVAAQVREGIQILPWGHSGEWTPEVMTMGTAHGPATVRLG